METPSKPLPGPSRLALRLRATAACALVAGFMLGCGPGTSKPDAPTITSFTPTSGPVATPVTVTGTGFATNVSLLNVFVGGVDTGVGTFLSNTSLTFTVPEGALSGPVKVVTNGGTAVSLLSFNVVPSGVGVTTAPPSVVNPPTGAIGTLVSITGHGLLGITHITMVATGGGVLTISPILPSTGTLITFDIPANADTAATNTITLDYGIGSLQIPFTVTPA